MPLYIRPFLIVAGLLLSGLPGAAAVGTDDLPDLGDDSATVISPAEERKLGEKFLRTARRQLTFIDDPELNQYITSLGNRLVAQSEGYYQTFRFLLIKDSNLNAFAVPGGFIGVHSGLILATKSESELASVLAHEIIHITQRHMPRMLAQTQQRSIPTMAALIAAVLLGGKAGQATIALATAANAQQQLSYTRAFEQESDRLGMRILVKSGYDPRAMPQFFERLQNWGRLYDTNIPEFLRTHPITSDRIAESRNRAESYPPRGKLDSTAFRHAQAKIRVVSARNHNETVKYFESRLKSGQYKFADAERYGYALALLASQRYAPARRVIEELLKRQSDNPSYRIVQAEIEMAASNYNKAVALYARAVQQTPSYRPLTRYYAAALLKTGRATKAKPLLQKAVRQQSDDPALYKLLATAAGNTGDRIEAHRALAEYYYLNGNPQEAISQLRIAARYGQDNYYIQSSVEARRREIQEEIDLDKGH